MKPQTAGPTGQGRRVPIRSTEALKNETAYLTLAVALIMHAFVSSVNSGT